MKYKLVIFDFDGTLADSFPFFLSVINQLADRHRFPRVDLEQVESLRGYSSRQLTKGAKIPFWRMPLIARDFRQLMGQQIGQIPCFAGVDELLRTLAAAGVRLAVVTSNSESNVRQVLGRENAALIQDYECGVALFGKHGKFRKVLRRSGLRPEQALCVGDEIRDAEAARREGIPFGAVSWGYTALEALRACAPAEVFTSVDQIAAALL